MDAPTSNNQFLHQHAELLTRSYRQLVGKDLVQPGPDIGLHLFQAPFFVASHDTAADPVLTYGNRTALELFDMEWDEFTSTPSRFTAEAPLREERARLLERVSRHGFIDDYSGVRIAKSGRRFRIQRATVWNLLDPEGKVAGQAATFDSWEALD